MRGLNLGIEFTGGRLLEVSTAQRITPDQARAAVAEAGYPNAVVQASGTDDITVRTGTISDDEAEKIRESISRIGGGTELVRNESIGPSLGEELRNKGLIALGIALLAQLLYLAVRFRWTFGAGAVLALLQNVAVVVGVFAWTGKPIDGIFLAAILTIIGYTVNDSVVVFDRIRETRNARSTGQPRHDHRHRDRQRPATDHQHRYLDALHPGARCCSSAATRWPTSPSRCCSASWSAPTRPT